MQCRICGSEGEHSIYVVKEMMLGLKDEHRYFQCRDCGCLQIESIPENLAAYYPSNYYSYSAPNSTNALKHQLLKQRDYYAVTGKSLLGHVLSLVAPNSKLNTLRPIQLNQDSRILDVGCGAGLLLNSLREAGFNQLLGLDPFNRDAIHYPNGLSIEKHDIFSETGQWDLIMFHHSFEHLVEQQRTLEQAHKLLDKNGTVLLRIPTVSSYAWQHYGVNWAQLDAPRHLFLHSGDSVKKLAEQTGFTVTKIQYDSNALQFWGSEQYEQDIALRSDRSWAENPANSPFTAAQIKQFEHRARELNALNKGDQAAFYLRKAS